MQLHPWLSPSITTFLKFAGVGAFNTVLTLAIIFSLKAGLQWSDAGANLAGYAVGLASSFVLNRRWTFSGNATGVLTVVRFLLVFGVAYTLNIGVVLGAIRLGVHEYLAHLTGMPVYTIAFFIGCRDFVFRAPTNVNAERRTWLAAPASLGGYLAIAAFMAFVLLYRLGDYGLDVWDEARLANNALEMAQNGLSLVTTYNGLPDHWNTKPPLLIWLMTLSFKLFGVSEIALRLPSVLASFATGSLIFWFCAGQLKRPFMGFVAVLVLFTNAGYVVYHGARSGDYDALLTLWTTGYLMAGYMFTRASPDRRAMWLALCAAGIALAFMTKTIQGLIFLPALCGYILWKMPLGQTLRLPAVYGAIFGIVGVVLGYYVLREQFDPGYFEAARANDLGGRYSSVHEGHANDNLYYVLMYDTFPWMIIAPLSFILIVRYGAQELRSVGNYLGLMAAFYFLIISTAATKLPWYAIPISPLIAMITAIAVEFVRAPLSNALRLAPRPSWILSAGACAIAGMLALLANVERIDIFANAKQATLHEHQHNFLKALVAGGGPRQHLVVPHHGFANGQGDKFYVAPTLFYINLARAAGHDVTLQHYAKQLPAAATSLLHCIPGPYRRVWPELRTVKPVTRNDCLLYEIERLPR
ncbi:MAG: GtrA family protein [Pseudomonadota bacterium]